MKKLIVGICVSVLAIMSGVVQAKIDMGDLSVMPKVFPCTIADSRITYGEKFVRCALPGVREVVNTRDPSTGEWVRAHSYYMGRCSSRGCRIDGHDVGNYPANVDFVLQLGFYITTNDEGRPIAYRNDVENMNLSTLEAQAYIHEYYLDQAYSEGRAMAMASEGYPGGTNGFKNYLQGNTSSSTPVDTNVVVTEAWCNPRMDDDCSINGNPVPKADLGKYLPTVDVDAVIAAGGACEFPICYNAEYKPIGIR